MKKNMIKAAVLASAIACTIFTACKKEEDTGLLVKGTNRNQSSFPGSVSEDRPKRPKGKISNSTMTGIQGAEIYLGRSLDSLVLDTCISDSSGDFESNIEVTQADYYVLIKATGYRAKYVSFTVPPGTYLYYDLGVIVLETSDPEITE